MSAPPNNFVDYAVTELQIFRQKVSCGQIYFRFLTRFSATA